MQKHVFRVSYWRTAWFVQNLSSSHWRWQENATLQNLALYKSSLIKVQKWSNSISILSQNSHYDQCKSKTYLQRGRNAPIMTVRNRQGSKPFPSAPSGKNQSNRRSENETKLQKTSKAAQQIVIVYQQTAPQSTAQSKFRPYYDDTKYFLIFLRSRHTIKECPLAPLHVRTAWTEQREKHIAKRPGENSRIPYRRVKQPHYGKRQVAHYSETKWILYCLWWWTRCLKIDPKESAQWQN